MTVQRHAKGLGLVVTQDPVDAGKKTIDKIEAWSDGQGKLQVGDRLLQINGTPCDGKSVKECIDPELESYTIVVLRHGAAAA